MSDDVVVDVDHAVDQLSLLNDAVYSVDEAKAQTAALKDYQASAFWGEVGSPPYEGPVQFMNNRRDHLKSVEQRLEGLSKALQDAKSIVTGVTGGTEEIESQDARIVRHAFYRPAPPEGGRGYGEQVYLV